jgi:hypothetical protein
MGSSTTVTLEAVKAAGEDFEWYPTTKRMIDVVAARMPTDASSIMDIGAGDGRVLTALAKRYETRPKLYAIEKSPVLIQEQPEEIIPVGTDLYQQNLACLQVDVIFCNPPYSEFEAWAMTVIESGHALKAYLVLPRRWRESKQIADSLNRRGATTRVLLSSDFLEADRRARAIVDVIEVRYPLKEEGYRSEVRDPFDIWFDQNISTFDQDIQAKDAEEAGSDIAKLRHLRTIADMVDAFNDEHGRMEENYRAIFKLDLALLRELGVNKEHVREGIKKKMAGLKNKYWHLLFERLDTIANRLSTATKQKFLEKMTGQATIAFTASNAYAVCLWAIKNANRYYDEQLVSLFRELSMRDGVLNYASNQRTWKESRWRYFRDDEERPTHYALDYRIVVPSWNALSRDAHKWDYPGGLHTKCHQLIDDIKAVLFNLGFPCCGTPSRERTWAGGEWQDFTLADGQVLFQVKAYLNGNVHMRFLPDAIKKLNVEAGRLLGWLRNCDDVVRELGYSPKEAKQAFGSNLQLTSATVKLLTAREVVPCR